MKTPIHRRAKAALALLAFAIISVIAGAFAVAAEATTVPQAAVAVVMATTVAIVVLAVAAKRPNESLMQAMFNLLIATKNAVLQNIITMTIIAMATKAKQAMWTAFNDTRRSFAPTSRRRHDTGNTNGTIQAHLDTGQIMAVNPATTWDQTDFDTAFADMMADPATYDPLATPQFIDVTAIDMIDADLVTA